MTFAKKDDILYYKINREREKKRENEKLAVNTHVINIY